MIAKIFAPLAGDGAFGLKDDVAVVRPAPSHDLVVKTDGIVESVHFFQNDPPGMIAQKALRVNLPTLRRKARRHWVICLRWRCPIGLTTNGSPLLPLGWPLIKNNSAFHC